MKSRLLSKTVFFVTSAFTLGIFFVHTVDGKSCSETSLPSWLDWRTEEAKADKHRPSLLESPFRTALVVIGAILIVLLNSLLCHLLYSDENIWGQGTYRMIFSLACNDCITGILLGIGVLTEIESVKKVIGCNIVIAGLWLCVVTSIYTFTVISVTRWLMLNHPGFYNQRFEENPMRAAYIAIACCWLAGACHAIPLLTSWNNHCVTTFDTCSLPYKSPAWIWGAAIFVFFLPSLVIVVVYTLILLKMRADKHQDLLASQTVTKTMSLLTAAFLLCWWPLGIYLSFRWNSVGGTRGFYAGAISSLVNPVLLIWVNNQLYSKVVAMFKTNLQVSKLRSFEIKTNPVTDSAV